MATQNTRRKQSEALRKLVAIGDKLSAEGKEVNEGTLRKEYREQYQEKPSEISAGQKNGNSSSYWGTSVAQSVENYKKKTEAKPASPTPELAEKTTQQMYDDAKKAYDDYVGSEEYKQKLNRIGKRLMRDDTKTRELNATVEHYRQQLQAEEDQRLMETDLKEFESWSEEDRNNLLRYIAERDQHAYNALNPMLDPQFDNYQLNPIVNKYGLGKVRQMAESVQRSKNAQAVKSTEEAAAKLANERPWLGGFAGSVASVGANLAGAYTGLMGYVVEAGQRTGRYSTLDPNNIGNLPSIYGQTVISEVSQNIQGDEENTNWLRQLAAVGYQGGMSAADSAARILASGGSAGISAVLAASGAFSNGVRQYSQQGASPEQAAAMAFVSAGFEYATEKLPTEKVLSIFKKGNTKGAVRDMLAQAFLVDPTSEEVNLFANVAAETAILGEKSSSKQRIGDLIAGGMSYEEAQVQVYKELGKEALQTYAVSSFAGLAGSGTAVIAGSIANNSQQQETLQQDAPAAPVEQQQQDFVEVTGEQLSQQMPEPEPPAPLTEGQQHLENAVAELMGVPVQSSEQQTTNAVTNPIESYPVEKQNVIRSFLNSVDQGIKNFVERVKGGDKTFERHKISDVSSRAAKDIGGLLNIDANGYTHNINTNGVLHILNRHGSNGEHDQTMSLGDDIARVGWVLENYDSVEPVIENGKQVYSTEFMGKENSPAPLVKFTKKIDGTYYVVEAACENKYKKLWVQSAYLQKNGDITQAPAESPSAIRETHAQSDLASPSPINIVADTEAEVKGTGAAEQNFSGKAQYQDLLYEGNVQRDRPGDVRPMEVPKTDPYGRDVSEFVGNAYGAEVTPDRMANEIESLVQEGALGFDRRGNQDALNDAASEIEKKGASNIRNQITRNIANGKIVDGDIEKAMLLYSSYANKNGIRAQESAAEILVDLTTMAHMTGRNLQLFKLLRKMTPEGQLMAINQTVQRNVENMKRTGQVKKDYHAQLDPQLIQEYEKAAKENARAVSQEQKEVSAERMQEIQQAIFAAEAAKMPATFKAKWDAWRYMSMLGNAKTQVRNLVGNLAFMPYKAAKDKMAAVFEKALPKEQRTKAIGTDFELLSWARNDAKTTDVKNALKYSAKLGDDVTSAQFAENRKIFDNKALDSVRKFVEKVPQAGDMIFKNDYYARSLASFLKARGYNAEAINSGKVSDAVLSEARGYAIQEAMKATFNDCNAFSDAIASIGRKNTDNVWNKALNIAAEGILPFRRTPANIAVRFAEYSPAGLVKGVWDMATKVRNGDISAAAAIDQISSGLTGSAVMALGFFLAKGIGGVKITGSGTDEDEKRQGHQDYAVEFSVDGQEYSYKIDWAAPANLPLFVGANIYKAMEDAGANTDVSTFTSILHGMGTMFEPMLALSCMSSLNDLVEGIRYAPEGEALYSIVADMATSYFMQGIPALLRQTYQATQENKQTTFANSEDATMRDLQKIGAQIPFLGAEYQTDKRNAWGETETTESAWERAVNAYFNPGTYKKISKDPVEMELSRLNEAQTENVSLPTTAKTISYTDTAGVKHSNMRLTESQYQTLATTQGQTAKKLLDQLIASDDYKALTDSQKAKAIDAVYQYAAEEGKKAALEDYDSDAAAWIKEAAKDPMTAFVNRVVSADLGDAMSELVGAWNENRSDQEATADLESAYQVYSNLGDDAQKAIKENAEGRLKYFLTAAEKGIDAQTFTGLYKSFWEIDGTNQKENEKAQQWAYTLERAQETKEITAAQKNTLKETMNFWQMIPAEAKKFDALTESGLSAQEARSTARTVNNLIPEDGNKTVSDVQKWEAIAAGTLSDLKKDQAIKAYMTDYDPDSGNPDKTELKYDYARKELGLTPKQYVSAYRVQANGGTKAEKIAAWKAQGHTDGEATALYYLLAGSGKNKIDVVSWYENQ